jgi:hypothetical protein
MPSSDDASSLVRENGPDRQSALGEPSLGLLQSLLYQYLHIHIRPREKDMDLILSKHYEMVIIL